MKNKYDEYGNRRSYANANRVFGRLGDKKYYKNKCDYCNAWCCRRMLFPIYSADHERWIKYHKHPLLKIKKIWGRKLIELKVPCSKLKDNRCTIYKDRPMMCQELNCELFEEGTMQIK
jgi:Fe-S-cluster containining protein